MSSWPTEITGVREDSTFQITGTFKDEAGVAIPAADLATAKIWLYDHLGTVINSRTAVNILNTGPGVITAGGVLTLTLAPLDNPIVGTGTETVERHLLIIEWTWNAGVKKSHESIILVLTQDDKVPTA